MSLPVVTPRYALCRGGPHDNERWPLVRDVGPGDTFVWEDAGGRVGYAVLAEIVQSNRGPMWVAAPVAAWAPQVGGSRWVPGKRGATQGSHR